MMNRSLSSGTRILLLTFCVIGLSSQAVQEYVAKINIGFHSVIELKAVENDETFSTTMRDAVRKTVKSLGETAAPIEWKSGGDRVEFDEERKSLLVAVHGTDPVLCMYYANTLAAYLLSGLDEKHDVRVFFKMPCSPWSTSMGAVPLTRGEKESEDGRPRPAGEIETNAAARKDAEEIRGDPQNKAPISATPSDDRSPPQEAKPKTPTP